MDKTTFMVIGAVLQVAIALAGMVVASVILVMGIINKDSKKIKKGVMMFLVTWILLVVLGGTEFILLATVWP